jgi:hypothetical protein
MSVLQVLLGRSDQAANDKKIVQSAMGPTTIAAPPRGFDSMTEGL